MKARKHSHRAERGAALVVSLIMLTLITMMLASAFALSTTNSKSVTNTQIRNEAIAAANAAIEQVVSSPFTDAPAAESINIDINNDGTVDYTVNFAVPKCLSSTTVTPTSLPVSSLSLGSTFASISSSGDSSNMPSCPSPALLISASIGPTDDSISATAAGISSNCVTSRIRARVRCLSNAANCSRTASVRTVPMTV